jgi:hypothetical protein
MEHVFDHPHFDERASEPDGTSPGYRCFETLFDLGGKDNADRQSLCIIREAESVTLFPYLWYRQYLNAGT